jgi:hypothetical protein
MKYWSYVGTYDQALKNCGCKYELLFPFARDFYFYNYKKPSDNEQWTMNIR